MWWVSYIEFKFFSFLISHSLGGFFFFKLKRMEKWELKFFFFVFQSFSIFFFFLFFISDFVPVNPFRHAASFPQNKKNKKNMKRADLNSYCPISGIVVWGTMVHSYNFQLLFFFFFFFFFAHPKSNLSFFRLAFTFRKIHSFFKKTEIKSILIN